MAFLMGPRTRRQALAAVVVLGMLVGGLYLWHRPGDGTVRITAVFPSAVGVYKGSEVRLMGVPIGHVTAVVPASGSVSLQMEYDARYRLPADAKAVIIAPSIISDRFVQLTPAYDGHGAILTSGAVIPETSTRVPVELDQVFSATNRLTTALGPKGANRNGALQRALHVGATNLDGQGAALHQTIADLGGAASTLGRSSRDFFGTVRHLQALTSTLVDNDGAVKTFDRQLAHVSGFLADERGNLSAVLNRLAQSFGLVDRFVRRNRVGLVSNVSHLTGIARALNAERASLETLLRLTPVGLNNLNRTWDPSVQGIRSRANLDRLLDDPDGIVCDALIRAGVVPTKQVCAVLSTALGGKG